MRSDDTSERDLEPPPGFEVMRGDKLDPLFGARDRWAYRGRVGARTVIGSGCATRAHACRAAWAHWGMVGEATTVAIVPLDSPAEIKLATLAPWLRELIRQLEGAPWRPVLAGSRPALRQIFVARLRPELPDIQPWIDSELESSTHDNDGQRNGG